MKERKIKPEIQEHIDDMNTRYAPEIEYSLLRTKWFTDLESVSECELKPIHLAEMAKSVKVAGKEGTEIQVVPGYTQEFALTVAEPCCILNFASFTVPGGGYTWGSIAQEEGLCSISTLYNVLKRLETPVYRTHNANRFSYFSLYADSIIYTPDIVFDSNDKAHKHDVLTCAAPNAYSAKTEGYYDDEIKETMRHRIYHILMAAACTCSDKTLVLGAYGCGAFGNDVEFVAKTFRDYLRGEFAMMFKKVVFVVPKDSRNKNLEVFKTVFAEVC